MWLYSCSTSIIEDRDLSAHLNILTIRGILEGFCHAGRFGPPLDHPVGVLLPNRLVLAGLAASGAKQRAVGIAGIT
jgi:hypothetical protein